MSELSKHFHFGQWHGSQETISGRGSSLAYTAPLRNALPDLLERLGVGVLVDAPCGDFNWMSNVDLKGIQYIGIDIVPEIIERNQSLYPDKEFVVADITLTELPQADLLITRDCLFHLPFKSIADWMERVRESAPAWLLVTSNVNPRNFDIDRPGRYRPVNLLADPFRFTPPIPDHVIADFPENEAERYMFLWSRDEYEAFLTDERIDAVRKFHNDQATSRRKSSGRRPHPRREDYRYYNSLVDSTLLAKIIETSQEHLGFFTRHLPRRLEYPWILERVSKCGETIVDLGAGVSPLPLLLALAGKHVTTVDYSDTVREIAEKSTWNEWGYLDYAQIDPAIRSINADFTKVILDAGSIDCVYSVSVIEHMPAQVRREIWLRSADALAPQGMLILSLDLQRGGSRLWNKDRGKAVEPPDEHGRLGHIVEELADVGIGIEKMEIHRNLPCAFTDIALLSCRKLAVKVAGNA